VGTDPVVTPSSEPRIRILCVDDHTVVREGVASIINKQADMEVVGFAANGSDAILAFRHHRPDVTLMDLRLPGMSGFDAIRAIRRISPDTLIIVLTMYQGDEDMHRALEAGAAAYLLKDTLADYLVNTIRDVFGAGREETVHAHRGKAAILSHREEEVLRLLAKGLRNKEIGAELHITEGTVDTHVKRIYSKLQVHDRTGALMAAIQRGIIHVD
jgi:DNA-binding NarL/FixJ family response regulator